MTQGQAFKAADQGLEVVTCEGDVDVIAQFRSFNGVVLACLESDQYSWWALTDLELAR